MSDSMLAIARVIFFLGEDRLDASQADALRATSEWEASALRSALDLTRPSHLENTDHVEGRTVRQARAFRRPQVLSIKAVLDACVR